MRRTGKHFIQQFTEANPDLYNDQSPDNVGLVAFDYVEGYSRLFWIIPKTDIEKKIFKLLSHEFGDNSLFLQRKVWWISFRRYYYTS